MKNKEKGQKSFGKIVLKFIGILAVCFGAGILTGILTGMLIRKIEDSGINFGGWFENVKPNLAYLILIAGSILIIGELVYSIYRIHKSKKLFKNWNDEEEIIQMAEYGLDQCVYGSNIVGILEMFLYAANIICANYIKEEKFALYIIIVTVAFFMELFILLFVQRAVVQEIKKINPEKRGELLEMGFQKKWMESCDEAQKTMIGQAAYKAFMAANYVCMGLWLICTIGIISFNFGILPITFVTIIWLTLIISFQIAGRKLEYGNLLKK